MYTFRYMVEVCRTNDVQHREEDLRGGGVTRRTATTSLLLAKLSEGNECDLTTTLIEYQ